jgi:hypothetical protein
LVGLFAGTQLDDGLIDAVRRGLKDAKRIGRAFSQSAAPEEADLPGQDRLIAREIDGGRGNNTALRSCWAICFYFLVIAGGAIKFEQSWAGPAQ